MDVSKVLEDVVLLERGVKNLYAEIAGRTENAETASILRILAAESEAHAKTLEARYGVSGKTSSRNEGVKGLLSLLRERISNIRNKTEPSEILREGIAIEDYMEKLYTELADSYKMGEQVDILLDKKQEEALKVSEIFRQIAADERRHRHMLQEYASQILKRETTRKV